MKECDFCRIEFKNKEISRLNNLNICKYCKEIYELLEMEDFYDYKIDEDDWLESIKWFLIDEYFYGLEPRERVKFIKEILSRKSENKERQE